MDKGVGPLFVQWLAKSPVNNLLRLFLEKVEQWDKDALELVSSCLPEFHRLEVFAIDLDNVDITDWFD